jgi:hypothetical protein
MEHLSYESNNTNQVLITRLEYEAGIDKALSAMQEFIELLEPDVRENSKALFLVVAALTGFDLKEAITQLRELIQEGITLKLPYSYTSKLTKIENFLKALANKKIVKDIHTSDNIEVLPSYDESNPDIYSNPDFYNNLESKNKSSHLQTQRKIEYRPVLTKTGLVSELTIDASEFGDQIDESETPSLIDVIVDQNNENEKKSLTYLVQKIEQDPDLESDELFEELSTNLESTYNLDFAKSRKVTQLDEYEYLQKLNLLRNATEIVNIIQDKPDNVSQLNQEKINKVLDVILHHLESIKIQTLKKDNAIKQLANLFDGKAADSDESTDNIINITEAVNQITHLKDYINNDEKDLITIQDLIQSAKNIIAIPTELPFNDRIEILDSLSRIEQLFDR